MCGSYLTLSFRVRNSFDDMVLKNEKFKFYINDEEIDILKKYDGYYVIVNLQEKCFNLKILSHNYIDKIIDVDLDKINNEDNYMEIYLIPNYQYLKPPSRYCVDGVSDKNTMVVITKLSNRTNVRFQSFDHKRNVLTVLNPAEESLQGRFMAVIDCERNKFQSFFIKENLNNNEYEIDNLIDKNYKSSYPIQKAYVTKTDDNGMYKLYLNNNDIYDERYIIMLYKNNKKIFKLLDSKFEIIK